MRTPIVCAMLVALLQVPVNPLGAIVLLAARPAGTSVRADALVAGSWNGITVIAEDAAGFQVRVGFRDEGGHFVDGDHVGGFLTGIENLLSGKAAAIPPKHPLPPSANLPAFYESVTEVGPHAADGSYARLVWNPLYPYDDGSRIRLEWARVSSSTVLARVSHEESTAQRHDVSRERMSDILLETFSPFNFKANYDVRDHAIFATGEYQPATWESSWDRWQFRFSDSSQLPHDRERGFRAGFWRADADDSRWTTVRWGAYWQESPTYIGKSGYAWYRAHFTIPERARGRLVRIDLGRIRQNDWTFVNGALIGSTSSSETEREYLIRPGSTTYENIKWGAENSLAVQVQSTGDLGGISSGQYLRAVRLTPPTRPRIQALQRAKRSLNFVLLASQQPKASGTYAILRELEQHLNSGEGLIPSDGAACAALLFEHLPTESRGPRASKVLYFVLKVGTQSKTALLEDAKRVLASDPASLIEGRRIQYEAHRVQTEGGLAEAADMMTNTMHWNVLYSPEQRRALIVDSRRWFLPDSWTLFGNSAILTAWAEALEGKRLAEDTFRGVMAEQLPDGRIMNAVGAMVTTPDRSQDMYAAYVAWKIYQKWGDKEFLRDVYGPVKAWHEWWFKDRGDGQPWRDGNHDGLLELGNNLSPFDAAQAAPDTQEYGLHHQAAMWEAFDDSPMWGWYQKGISLHPGLYRGQDNVQYVFRTGTLNLDTAPTNALWALSAEMLAHIAHELGDEPGEKVFRLQYEQIKERINKQLWDERTGMYLNRFWPEAGGGFSNRKSPALLWMMAAGIPSSAQAARLVRDHLLNPKEFWTDYVLPSISRDDPAFPEQYYWRGTIWPPMNFLVYEGLKRYGYDDVAADLAFRTYHLVRRNWDETHALWENYNSVTGEGNAHGAGGSTKHYAWSADFPALAIMECIDQEAWSDGLRFGSIGVSEPIRVRNLWIRAHAYDVILGPDLTELRRDGGRIFSARGQVIVRRFKWSADCVAFNAKLPPSGEGTLITLGTQGPRRKHVVILVDGIPVPLVIRGTDVTFSIPGGEHKVEAKIRAIN